MDCAVLIRSGKSRRVRSPATTIVVLISRQISDAPVGIDRGKSGRLASVVVTVIEPGNVCDVAAWYFSAGLRQRRRSGTTGRNGLEDGLCGRWCAVASFCAFDAADALPCVPTEVGGLSKRLCMFIGARNRFSAMLGTGVVRADRGVQGGDWFYRTVTPVVLDAGDRPGHEFPPHLASPRLAGGRTSAQARPPCHGCRLLPI